MTEVLDFVTKPVIMGVQRRQIPESKCGRAFEIFIL